MVSQYEKDSPLCGLSLHLTVGTSVQVSVRESFVKFKCAVVLRIHVRCSGEPRPLSMDGQAHGYSRYSAKLQIYVLLYFKVALDSYDK